MTGSTFGRSISNCSCFRLFRNLPPHSGQHGNSATFVSFTSFRLGLARCTKRPCPALRPGRLGCSTHCLRANGVACLFPVRFSSSTSACKSSTRFCSLSFCRCSFSVRTSTSANCCSSSAIRLSFESGRLLFLFLRLLMFQSVQSSTLLLQEFFSLFFSRPSTLYKIMLSHGKQVRWSSRTHVLYYTDLRWVVNQFRRFPPPPDIPRAEARGFTAGLVITSLDEAFAILPTRLTSHPSLFECARILC